MSRNIEHELQQAKSRVCQLEADLKEKRRQVRNLELEIVERDFGVKIGSVVVKNGKIFSVTRIEAWSRRPSLHGAILKKDGTPSLRDQYIGPDWTLEPKL